MIDQKEVIEFFDTLAPKWDSDNEHSDEKINIILNNAGVTEGKKVLDVACGTGVMIPYYLSRGVKSVTAIDISSEMIRIAKEKFPQDNVSFICGDVEQTDVGRDFDAIVIYNAFPHFPNGERLIGHLSSLLKEGGMLTVAHGSSREVIDSHHKRAANRVSNGLPVAEELSETFSKYLSVKIVISDEKMYQVAGQK